MTTRRIYVPKKYQPLLTNHMLEHKRCALFARMGMGKSVSVLTGVDTLFLAGAETKPGIIFAPYRVAAKTWPDEVKKWDHLRHIEIHPMIGTASQREMMLKQALRSGNSSLYSINYENIGWLMQALKDEQGDRTWPFSTVIADESTKLKGLRMSYRTSKTGKQFLAGQGGKRTAELSHIAHRYCSRWINASGTPTPNGLKDLWGQTWFLDGGKRLGRTYTSFMDRWFQISPYDGRTVTPLPHAQKEIQDAISDICISLDPKDYFDLAEPIVTDVLVDIPAKARGIYREMEKKMFAEVEDHLLKRHRIDAPNAAALTNKCLQISNGAAYVPGEDERNAQQWVEIHDAKLDALEDIFEEAAGEPILVAYHFKSDLARLKKRFPFARVLDKKPETQDQWNNGEIPMLLAHPASAGHGLNLARGGNILVFFSIWWNWEEHAQIIERIGPMRQLQEGMDRVLHIYYIHVINTLEQKRVRERLQTKKSVEEILMEALKAEKNQPVNG